MESLYDLIGILVGSAGLFIIVGLAKTFRKVLDETEGSPTEEEHTENLTESTEKAEEATTKAQEKQDEANDHFENDEDRDVVDRAWDAFRTKPPRD